MLTRNSIFLLGGILILPTLSSAAFHFFDPTDTANAPQLLSQTGLYVSTAATTKQVTPEAVPYEVNAALWSDGAVKQRWIILPAGKKIAWMDDTDLFSYPDSTVFAKTFLQEHFPGDSSPVYWETRFLMFGKDSIWHGFSYRWNAAQTDAQLVSPSKGFDTVFYYNPNGMSKPMSYKKWHYPSQNDCSQCHGGAQPPSDRGNGLEFTRGVMGFYPAQLKRPSTITPTATPNQIDYLFSKNVFSGTKPTGAALNHRFIGMHEPITATTPAARFATIDTMARSYLAANCSGCHSARGMRWGLANAAQQNLDFYRFIPNQELATFGPPYSVSAQDTSTDPNKTDSRIAYITRVAMGGMDTSATGIWNMAIPAGMDLDTLPTTPFVYPGYPALSEILYRQWARTPPWQDSATLKLFLDRKVVGSDSAGAVDATALLTWIFTKPWGSQEWRTLLTQHNVTVDSLMKNFSSRLPAVKYTPISFQMPPLATYLPDTAALKILGEWAKTYRSATITGINGAARPAFTYTGPHILNHTLFVPKGWEGKASMLDITGRVYSLKSLGKGAYALPSDIHAGVFFFRVGSHYFKNSMF